MCVVCRGAKATLHTECGSAPAWFLILSFLILGFVQSWYLTHTHTDTHRLLPAYRFYLESLVLVGSISCCIWCAIFMVHGRFQNHWHNSETGWQKLGGLVMGCQMCVGMWDGGLGSGGRHEDGERMAVCSAGQGGNKGGVQSPACGLAAKLTVMLATGTGCCGPQVVLVRTSKGQAVNMKT